MNISDVEAAQEAWEKAVQGMGLQLPAWHSLGPMLAALESFALSHAVGQEADNIIEDERLNKVRAYIEDLMVKADENEADGEHIDEMVSASFRYVADGVQKILDTPRDTPAQPPASAEVGRDAARYRAQFGEDGTWDYSDLWCGETKEAVDAMLDRGIASSGRNGGECG